MDAAAASFSVHGGRLAAASRQFGRPIDEWIDLSTGISPFVYPHDPSAADHRRLLEPEDLAALEQVAAHAFGVADAETVVALPGTDLAIRLLPHLVQSKHPAILLPIYGGHRAAWPGARPVRSDTIASAGADCDLLILCNPNNPDGRITPPDVLRTLPCPLIVDEAFADLHPETSLLPERAGAIVLRSFGKFFGLAGIRLGFVVADRPLARRLRDLVGDWPVSSLAIAAGRAAYADLGWQSAQRARLADAAARLDALLARADMEIVGGTSLFRLARHRHAGDLFAWLARAGILVRPFADRPDLLRFGIPGTDDAWQRLSATVGAWKNQQ